MAGKMKSQFGERTTDLVACETHWESCSSLLECKSSFQCSGLRGCDCDEGFWLDNTQQIQNFGGIYFNPRTLLNVMSFGKTLGNRLFTWLYESTFSSLS